MSEPAELSKAELDDMIRILKDDRVKKNRAHYRADRRSLNELRKSEEEIGNVRDSK